MKIVGCDKNKEEIINSVNRIVVEWIEEIG